MLELGAGAGLPSLISAHLSAKRVVVTDYPDADLITNLSYNIEACAPSLPIVAKGYLWGADSSPLIEEVKPDEAFDVLILADLLFNHSEHGKLVQTVTKSLKKNGTALVFFTPYRPWLLEKDLAFFDLARENGLIVEKVLEKVMEKVMFEEDPGVRSFLGRNFPLVLTILFLGRTSAPNRLRLRDEMGINTDRQGQSFDYGSQLVTCLLRICMHLRVISYVRRLRLHRHCNQSLARSSQAGLGKPFTSRQGLRDHLEVHHPYPQDLRPYHPCLQDRHAGLRADRHGVLDHPFPYLLEDRPYHPNQIVRRVEKVHQILRSNGHHRILDDRRIPGDHRSCHHPFPWNHRHSRLEVDHSFVGRSLVVVEEDP